jgi:hypothetical protein
MCKTSQMAMFNPLHGPVHTECKQTGADDGGNDTNATFPC